MSPLQLLNEKSSRIQSEEREISSLKKEIEGMKKAHSVRWESWNEEANKLKEKVKNREVSLGDPIRDYVFVNYILHPGESWKEFQEGVDKLKSTLDAVSEAKCFWYETNNFQKGTTYELLFLKKESYVITPAEIRLQSQSSVSISIEPVFERSNEDKAMWAFVRANESTQTIVAPEGIYQGRIPRLYAGPTNVESLEERLKENPLALSGLKKALGQEVSIDLQKQADEYTSEVALWAIQRIKEQYEKIKDKDRKIQEIEAKWLGSQKEDGMYATKPVIIHDGPDPFMAAIQSSDDRTERGWAFKNLATYIQDLDKTGLATYDKPMEVRVSAGEKTVYNLSQFARYVRNVLEISCKEKVTV